MKTIQTKIKTPDYGQDMPGIIIAAIILFVIFGALAIWQYTQFSLSNKNPALVMLIILALLSAMSLAMAVSGIWSSRYGKLILREKTLNLLYFKGDENILDLGCGKGLLLIEAAKRLPHGNATGADIWNHNFEYNSSSQIVMENARLECVADRVKVFTADAQNMPFNDNSFNILMTSLMMHHVKDTQKAINEMIRVTKPGGKIVIADVNSKKIFRYVSATRLKKSRNVLWNKTILCTSLYNYW